MRWSADLPAVAVRAVQDVEPPPVGQPGHVGQLVAQAGGDQQPPRRHRALAVRALIWTPNRSPSRARAVTRPVSTRPPYPVTSARPAA